ncbi:class I lanthipeptide [Spirosoma areae]
MKKKVVKIALKTDKVVSLSKSQTRHIVGGLIASRHFCDPNKHN